MNSTNLSKPTHATVANLGYAASILTTLLTIFTFGIAILTPPSAGPFCRANCYTYPYTDIASRFPRDYWWMYPAMVLTLVYFVLVACIHYFAAKEKKIYSFVGTALGLFSTILLITNYFLQVSVIQPSLLLGEADGVSMLSQFNPHGVFIALEDLGYLVMSMSLAFLVPVFSTKNKAEKSIRWVFLANLVLNIIALIGFTAAYGVFREYRFEVATMSFNWLTLIISGLLLGTVFKRAKNIG